MSIRIARGAIPALLCLAVAIPTAACADSASDSTPEREPAAVATPLARADSTTSTPPRVLFFGDSYFVGHDDFPASKSWAARTATRLGWDPAITGAGGTGFVGDNPEYDLPDYLGQIANGAFDVGKRRWVIVEGGTNDYGYPLEKVEKHARRVLKIARRDFPNARIVLVGPMSPDADYSNDAPIAAVLKKAAKRREVPFVDVTDWLGGTHMQADGNHPTSKGYKILARKLAKQLRKLGA